MRRTLKAARAWDVVGMVGLLLAGLMVLYISFWVSYGVIWLISHSFFPLSHRTILLIASLFMLLVVIVGARQNQADLEPLEKQVNLARDMDITLTPYNRYGMSYNTNAIKAGAFEIQSLASVINYILCGGVIMVLGSFRRLRHFRRLQAIDADECARVIALLHTAGRRQSFVEIVEKLPGLDPVRVFDDLRSIEAVLFLSNDPPGLTLHPELRDELNRLTEVGRTESV